MNTKKKKDKEKLHQPHDKLFKSAFGKKLVTRDFLLNRLPPKILAQIDMDSLTRDNNSYIDERLKPYYTDIVFRVKTTKGEDGYLFFLLEHQTEADKLTPLRLLEYTVAIMRYDIEQQIEKSGAQKKPLKLPVVFSFVIYAGEEYSYPRRLIDAFRTPELLFPMFEAPFLIHLKKDAEQQILKDGEAALAGLLLREEYREDFCRFLAEHPKIVELINKSTYAKSAIMYMLDRDPHDVEEVLKKITNLNPRIRRNVMSALQKIEEKGVKLGIIKGKKEGKKEEKKEIAKHMLAKGMEASLISEITGLSLKEIEALNNKGKE